MIGASCDVVVVGAGIVGLATALRLLERARLDLVVLEAEPEIAIHQTGHNSGVIHSGIYYPPGSLKARLCVEGRQDLYLFCRERGIRHERCGKLIVATRGDEIGRLDEIERRGEANGLTGLRRLRGAAEIRELEPHAGGIEALHVPDTGIVDYRAVASAMADVIRGRNGIVATGGAVMRVTARNGVLCVETTRGEVRARFLVNCAGLYSDRIARLCGADPDVRIVPFRGEYWVIAPERAHLVRNLIYPVPDPTYPFLGVHFTRRVGGEIEAGPNAVLAFRREGYGRWDFSLRDTIEILTYPGAWHLFRKHWRTGLAEYHRSFSRKALVLALRTLVPEIREEDVRAGGAGVRAQAVDRSGRLVDDFRIVESERMIHVLNAPSPAATASLAIGRTIADAAIRTFGLPSGP